MQLMDTQSLSRSQKLLFSHNSAIIFIFLTFYVKTNGKFTSLQHVILSTFSASWLRLVIMGHVYIYKCW